MVKTTETRKEFSCQIKNITVYLGNKCRMEFIEEHNDSGCRLEAKGDPVFIRYLDAEMDGDILIVQIKNPCGSPIKWEEYDRKNYRDENLVRIYTGCTANITTINYLDLTALSHDNAEGNHEIICS